jgi:hypothetical protein
MGNTQSSSNNDINQQEQSQNVTVKNILNRSRKLWKEYHTDFLDPKFCNKIALVQYNELIELPVEQLQEINSTINNTKMNDNKRLSVVLKRRVKDNEKYKVRKLQGKINNYFSDKRRVKAVKKILGVDIRLYNNYISRDAREYLDKALPKNKNGYNHQFKHGGDISNQNFNKLLSNLEHMDDNKHKKQNNNRNNNKNNTKNNTNNTSSSNTRNNSRNNSRNNNKIIINKRNNNTLFEKNLNLLSKEINKNNNKNNNINIKSLFDNNTNNNNNKNNKNNNVNINVNSVKTNKTNNKTNNSVNNRTNNRINNRTNNRTNNKTVNNRTNNTNKTILNKQKLCDSIILHYTLRANIIAAIVSALPLEKGGRNIGGLCAKRISSLENGKFCLPKDFNNLINLDPKERIRILNKYVYQDTPTKCNEKGGIYKVLTDNEKMALVKSRSKINKEYMRKLKLLKTYYNNKIKELETIVLYLDKPMLIDNEELETISKTTKEILDEMYSVCQSEYLLSMMNLMGVDLTISKEDDPRHVSQYETLKQLSIINSKK